MKKPTLIAVSSMVAMAVPTVSEKITTSDMRKDIIRANVADIERDNENNVPTLDTPNPENSVNSSNPDLITVTLTQDGRNTKLSDKKEIYQEQNFQENQKENQKNEEISQQSKTSSSSLAEIQNDDNKEHSINDSQRIQLLKSDIITLRSIDLRFQKNSTSLKKEAYSVLEDVKDYVEKNDYLVSIVGYTDKSGLSSYNKRLSLKRAEKVGSKLLELGLSEDRILDFIGHGGMNPIASNETEKGREKNRRVEFRFMKKGQI